MSPYFVKLESQTVHSAIILCAVLFLSGQESHSLGGLSQNLRTNTPKMFFFNCLNSLQFYK